MINKGTIILMGVFLFSKYSYSQKRKTVNVKFPEGKVVVDVNIAQTIDSLYNDLPDQCILQIGFVNKSESYLSFSEQQAIQKKRALNVETYVQAHFVEDKNAYLQYTNKPSLVIYKPKAHLVASGEVDFSLLDQECVTINGKAPDIIYTVRGTKIEFQASSFESTTGLYYDESEIHICLYEFKSKKDLVMGQVTTQSNNEMLETAGSFYIEATDKNGRELKLKANKSFTITFYDVKNEKPVDFYTFSGNTNHGVVNWLQEIDQRSVVETNEFNEKEEVAEEEYIEGEGNFAVLDGVYIEEYSEANNLILKSSNLGWINCDRFYDVEHKTDVQITVHSDTTMCVRMVFNDISSVMPAYQLSNNKKEYVFQNIPVGEKVLILVYSVNGSEAALSYKEIVIGEDFNDQFALNEMSVGRLEGLVQELIVN